VLPGELSAGRKRRLHEALWRAASAPGWLRPLPWRATRDPWAVLVAEVMLQQTQAARVAVAWGPFVAAFPDARTLAQAGAASTIASWGRLGYPRRALALWHTACTLVDRHDGVPPRDAVELMALPGVGEATARAVLAFAYELPVSVLDVNVRRVLERAVAGRPLARSALIRLADELVPAGWPWLWNQALLDVGARLCRARRPRCGACPLAAECVWRLAGTPEPDPARRPRSGRPAYRGSDRQARGRLIEALRRAPVADAALPAVMGLSAEPERARRLLDRLMQEGLVSRRGSRLVLGPGDATAWLRTGALEREGHRSLRRRGTRGRGG
jgi:A/G-specific adenine glycosylase